jgi:hypothetical protein
MSVLPFVIDTGVANLPWSPSPAPDRSAISISSAMRVMSPVMREARCLPDRLGVLALHVYQRHITATHLLNSLEKINDNHQSTHRQSNRRTRL